MGNVVELMDDKAMGRSISRIAHEIVEKNKGVKDVLLLGIKTRGLPLAKRIAQRVLKFEGESLKVEEIDIAFYRDDLEKKASQPFVQSVNNLDVEDKIIILVDDFHRSYLPGCNKCGYGYGKTTKGATCSTG